MNEILGYYVLLSFGFSILIPLFAGISIGGTSDKYNFLPKYWGCPNYIYDNTKMNIFGVMTIFTVLLCIMPFYYIGWFIYWAFHIGRE